MSNPHAPPPSAHELQLLLEEKNRLLKRLQEKRAGIAHSKSRPAAPSADEQREAGFNLYTSGANEIRIKEQQKRQVMRKDAAPRTKTWSKPQSNPNSSREQNQDSEIEEEVITPSNAAAAAGGAASKVKRKQWNVAPVVLKGAEAASAPPARSAQHAGGQSLMPPESDEVEEEYEAAEAAHQAQLAAQQAAAIEQYAQETEAVEIEEDSLEVETESYEDEAFDPLSPPRPSPGGARVRQNRAGGNGAAESSINGVALRESIQEDISALRTRLAQADDSDRPSAVHEGEIEEDASSTTSDNLPPLSPPPIALRKKDVSLLRESLEVLDKNERPSVLPPQAERMQMQFQQRMEQQAQEEIREEVSHHVDPRITVPPLSHSFRAEEDDLYNQDITPLLSKRLDSNPYHRQSASSGGVGLGVAPSTAKDSSTGSGSDSVSPPVAVAAAAPKLASSNSPTLPTRSLHSSSSSSSISKPAHKSAPSQELGAFTNVRTSVSFSDETEDIRPSTPLNTDNSTLRTSLLLSQSFDKDAVESMLIRLKKLDKKKRGVLLKVLADLEKGDAADIPSDLKESLEILDATVQSKISPAAKHVSPAAAATTATAAVVAPTATSAAAIVAPRAAIPPPSTVSPPPSDDTPSPAASPPALQSKLSLLKQKQASAANSAAASPAAPAKALTQPSAVPSVSLNAAPAVPPPSDDELVVASFAPPAPSFTIRILGNWGANNGVGLTQLELFDERGNRMRVPPSAVHFAYTTNHPQPGPARSDAAKLFSNKPPLPNTTNESLMWSVARDRDALFPMPTGGQDAKKHGIEISIYLPSFFAPPAKLVVYNFNKSSFDSSRGARQVEIETEGKLVWEGELKRAPGMEGSEFGQSISLIPGRAVETEQRAEAEKLSEKNLKEEMHRKTAAALNLPAGALTAPNNAASAASTAAASTSASSRPLWLQGSDVPSTNPSPPPQQQTLGHSVSAATLGTLPAGRRRGTLGRENLSTAAGTGTDVGSVPATAAADSPNSGAMVPPLLPASGWENGGSGDVGAQAATVKRPMSGRRAVNPAAGSITATAASSAIPGSESAASRRLPSAGRRRPSFAGDEALPGPASGVAGSSLPTSASASPQHSPRPSPPIPSEEVHIPTGGEGRKKRTDLEESWDSLEHFKTHHRGRLPAANELPGATTTAAPTGPSKILAGSRSAAVLSSVAATPAQSDDSLGSRSARQSPTVDSESGSERNSPVEDFSAKPSAAAPPALFSLPILPCGRRLVFTLLSTYGDAYYVGLSGLELFDEKGHLIQFPDRKRCISASPADVNVLPGVKGDPRVVSNLLDGVNATCDDLHVWLAPFSAGKRHVVVIDFPSQTTLSFIRVWNYNKSRIHSARGVKDMEIHLDSKLIFKGDITQAPGNVEDAAKFSENLLFTTDSGILAKIASQGQKFESDSDKSSSAAAVSKDFEYPARPSTAGSSSGAGGAAEINVHTSVDFSVSRPKTSAVMRTKAPANDEDDDEDSLDLTPSVPAPVAMSKPQPARTAARSRYSVRGQEITFYLQSTWGDPYFVGLTGLEILDDQMNVIPLTISNLSAYPQDINTVPGHSGDNRTLDKLINNDNVTINDNNMWLAPVLQADDAAFQQSKPAGSSSKFGEQWLKVRLPSAKNISAFRFWNYNKNEEDTYRGMKWIKVTVDGNAVSPPNTSGFMLRKAPGNTDFDFSQTIYLEDFQANPVATIAPHMRKPFDYTMPILPTGFCLKILFLSTWGDAHYVGLNGLELFDHNGNTIPIQMHNIAAVPSSLNDLHSAAEMHTPDTRTVDKLFDGLNDTYDDRHMWLAPLLPGPIPGGQPRNVLYIYFDAAVALSGIKFWNYSKTPSRGVQAVQVLLDGVLIYDGILKMAPPPNQRSNQSFAQTMLFCQQQTLMEREAATLYREGTAMIEQDVLLVNERQFMTQPSAQAAPSIPVGKTHAQVAAASSKSATASRPKTMARGQ